MEATDFLMLKGGWPRSRWRSSRRGRRRAKTEIHWLGQATTKITTSSGK